MDSEKLAWKFPQRDLFQQLLRDVVSEMSLAEKERCRESFASRLADRKGKTRTKARTDEQALKKNFVKRFFTSSEALGFELSCTQRLHSLKHGDDVLMGAISICLPRDVQTRSSFGSLFVDICT